MTDRTKMGVYEWTGRLTQALTEIELAKTMCVAVASNAPAMPFDKHSPDLVREHLRRALAHLEGVE